MITPQTLAALENAPLSEIRRHVRGALERAPSFRSMPPGERRQVAHDLVRVLSFLTDPYGGQPELTPARAPVRALADDPKDRFKEDPESVKKAGQAASNDSLVQNDFKAKGASEAGTAFTTLTSAVDFPTFVGSLIEGVFTSIVNTSIKQMQEFGKFLEGVVKSVNEFAQEHVSQDEGRDFLRSKHPNVFKQGGGPLQLLDSLESDKVPDIQSIFGMSEVPDLSDEEIEQQVAASAQIQLARMRQQQLAMMVMLGINRIVVTEGEIKASVMFDVSSSDRAQRTSSASLDDVKSDTHTNQDWNYNQSRSFWGTSRGASGGSSSDVLTRVTTSHADTKTDSESKVDAKAKLTGFVQVKFKSETFPLERLASQLEMGAIQEKSKR